MTTEVVDRHSRPIAVDKPSRVEEKYPYGWREVPKITANGAGVVERIPLTIADVRHPQEDDFLMTSDEHARFCIYLYNILRWVLRDVPKPMYYMIRMLIGDFQRQAVHAQIWP